MATTVVPFLPVAACLASRLACSALPATEGGSIPAYVSLHGLIATQTLLDEWLLSGLAVDLLAEQVGVPVVPRILLNHVAHDPPQAG
jgi:hypothetical protein